MPSGPPLEEDANFDHKHWSLKSKRTHLHRKWKLSMEDRTDLCKQLCLKLHDLCLLCLQLALCLRQGILLAPHHSPQVLDLLNNSSSCIFIEVTFGCIGEELKDTAMVHSL